MVQRLAQAPLVLADTVDNLGVADTVDSPAVGTDKPLAGAVEDTAQLVLVAAVVRRPYHRRA